MFSVANVITLSVVPELLWKFTLIVRYKLGIFRPPRVNQLDICGLLFRGYARFIPLDKMVSYGYWKTLPSGSSLMLHIALRLFPLYNGICCRLFNYYPNNHNIVLCYMCFYYWLSGLNCIIYPTPNYWRKHLTELSYDVSL